MEGARGGCIPPPPLTTHPPSNYYACSSWMEGGEGGRSSGRSKNSCYSGYKISNFNGNCGSWCSFARATRARRSNFHWFFTFGLECYYFLHSILEFTNSILHFFSC
uniref:GIY-YIG endonuclease n=1 Tax=Morchella brunnea TaxID=1174671 RepID=A0A8K1MIG6_9PEZI|nr:GIY-YIG endonuclease [Morchella brunnea]UBU98447.1 GIY-YIG endonuclease [Morchella brunnea]